MEFPSPILAAQTASVSSLIALLVFGIVLLLLLILRFKLQAFLALLVASIAVALGASMLGDEITITQIGSTVTGGMGSALGFIATIIGIGAIFGAILQHSGGTQSLANSMLKRFGPDRAPWAMLVTGFIISIPVFLDVALVILAPLLYALARDTKKPLLVFGLPLVAGMAITHAFVPPTPGPVAVSLILGVNLGWVILFGVLIGLPTALICGPFLCSKVARFVDVPLPDHIPLDNPIPEHKLPPFLLILTLISLPIVMILANTIVEQVVASGLADTLAGDDRKAALAAALGEAPLWQQLIHFAGHPVIALLACTLLTVYFLGTKRGVDRQTLLEISTRALGPAGIIILITGAGGVFKGVLIATGIADALQEVFSGSGIPIVVLAYLFATLVRIAQGSATVAMLTAAGLMSALVSDLNAPNLALVTVAIAAGATGFSHVNDSGFWMISRYFGMTEAQTLKTWSLISTAISLVAFVLILIVSFFI
ncbi:MAG: Gnt-I system low-affinity gluconate transporter [Pseudoalteromonas tetraodonis]|jgi:Gnt-I system low-affinity gluconate transporter